MAQLYPIPISELDVSQAEKLKTEANKLFAAKKYDEAISNYTEAISYNPNVAAYYSNRAFAYVKLELYGAAIKDAEVALELDPKFLKAYYRRAVGNIGLGKLKVKDLRNVVKYAPQDADARTKLSECEKEYKRIEFEKAIRFDDLHKTALELLGNIDDMKVDSRYANMNLPNVSYDGPSFSQPDEISLEFVLELLEHLKAQKKLHIKYALQILRKAKELFELQPSIVDISVPKDHEITVCGDIHGQYYDLLHIFELNGHPSPQNMYLFNGDFVDRGAFSVECILALLAFKVLYPNAMFLTRGNHETNSMNSVYGFEKEVKSKYNELTFKLFSETFNALPLGHLIGSKIFVLHGGLFSRDDVLLDELRRIDRFKQPPQEGLMCEMLWSDPRALVGRGASQRGVAIQFGPDVTENFCKLNDLKCIIRSHEVKNEGYEVAHFGKCITIFSAPNYCDSMGNMGAYINIESDLELKFNQFPASPHPDVKSMMYSGALGSMFI